MQLKIEIASPCEESWDAMTGGDRVRHCGRCERNVYNVAELTTAEVQKLVQATEGGLCMRLFQREDGTLVTRDCASPKRAAPPFKKLMGYVVTKPRRENPPARPETAAAPARPLTALEAVMIGALAVLAIGFLIWLLR